MERPSLSHRPCSRGLFTISIYPLSKALWSLSAHTTSGITFTKFPQGHLPSFHQHVTTWIVACSSNPDPAVTFGMSIGRRFSQNTDCTIPCISLLQQPFLQSPTGPFIMTLCPCPAQPDPSSIHSTRAPTQVSVAGRTSDSLGDLFFASP